MVKMVYLCYVYLNNFLRSLKFYIKRKTHDSVFKQIDLYKIKPFI